MINEILSAAAASLDESDQKVHPGHSDASGNSRGRQEGNWSHLLFVDNISYLDMETLLLAGLSSSAVSSPG